MHLVVTEVDHVTHIPCTVEPQRTGPSMPAVKGLKIIWQDKSTWPVELGPDGTYLRAPKYYGTCDDDADIGIAGVLEVLTEAAYQSLKTAEHHARKPYPSWIGDEQKMTWDAPIPYPTGNVIYYWDESTISWSNK